jgi:hypothetical protein
VYGVEDHYTGSSTGDSSRVLSSGISSLSSNDSTYSIEEVKEVTAQVYEHTETQHSIMMPVMNGDFMTQTPRPHAYGYDLFIGAG